MNATILLFSLIKLLVKKKIISTVSLSNTSLFFLIMLLIFLDTETCGLNPTHHRILEIAFRIIDSRDHSVIASYSSLISHENEDVWKYRSAESVTITGLDKDYVNTHGKPEHIVAQEILELFSFYHISRDTAVFLCQNPSMDRTFFSQLISAEEQQKYKIPYHWLDLASMFWALEVMERGNLERSHSTLLSKNNIAKHFGIAEESFPHRALQGVDHLILCYRMLMDKVSKPKKFISWRNLLKREKQKTFLNKVM